MGQHVTVLAGEDIWGRRGQSLDRMPSRGDLRERYRTHESEASASQGRIGKTFPGEGNPQSPFVRRVESTDLPNSSRRVQKIARPGVPLQKGLRVEGRSVATFLARNLGTSDCPPRRRRSRRFVRRRFTESDGGAASSRSGRAERSSSSRRAGTRPRRTESPLGSTRARPPSARSTSDVARAAGRLLRGRSRRPVPPRGRCSGRGRGIGPAGRANSRASAQRLTSS